MISLIIRAGVLYSCWFTLDEKMECFIDVAKTVTLVWLYARLGAASFQPLHYPAYTTHTQETAQKGIYAGT